MSNVILRDFVVYSMEHDTPLTNPKELALYISEIEEKERLLNEKVADKISEVICTFNESSPDLSLYTIEHLLDDGTETRTTLINKCIEQTTGLFPSKNPEEVNKEITQILSKVHDNLHIMQSKTMQKDEILEVFSGSIYRILQDGLDRYTMPFENNDTFVDDKISYIFSEHLSMALGVAFCHVISLGNNKELDDRIDLFINKHGFITRRAVRDIIREQIFPLYENQIQKNLTKNFISIISEDQLLQESSVIVSAKEKQITQVYYTEYVQWAMEEIKDPAENKEEMPLILQQNRIEVFYDKYIKNKQYFHLSMILHDSIKEFIEANPEAIQSLHGFVKNKLRGKKLVNRDSVLDEMIPAILTSMLYYNAALSGRMNRETLQEKTIAEILVELSKDLTTIQNREIFKKNHIIVCLSMPAHVLINSRFPVGSSFIHLLDQANSDATLVMKAVFEDKSNDDKKIEDKIIGLLEQISLFIALKQTNAIVPKHVEPTDSDIAKMFMFVVSNKAEEFIFDSYTEAERELLEQQGGSSRILKSDSVLKTFLTTMMISQLAKCLHQEFYKSPLPEGNIPLKLVEVFKKAFQLQEVLPLTQENIIRHIGDKLFCFQLFSNLLNNIRGNEAVFSENLQKKFTMMLKEQSLDKENRFLCEYMREVCKSTLDVQMITASFCQYVFSDFVDKNNNLLRLESLKTTPGRFVSKRSKSSFFVGASMLRLRGYKIVQSSMEEMIGAEFVKEFKSISEDYLSCNPKEFNNFQRIVQKRGSGISVQRRDYDTKKSIKAVLHYGCADKMPALVFSIMFMVWAKSQGLVKLEKKKKLSPKEIILEVLSSSELFQEGLREFITLGFTLSNRDLFSILEKLDSHKTSKRELEFIAFHFSITVDEQEKGECHFTSIAKSFSNYLKKEMDKQARISNPEIQEKVKQQPIEVSKKQDKRDESGKQPEFEDEKPLSKTERSRIRRLEIQKQRKEERRQRELQLLQSNDFIVEEDVSSTLDGLQAITGNVMQEKTGVAEAQVFAGVESSETSSSEESDEDKATVQQLDEDEDLKYMTTDEVYYEAQEIALDELDDELGGLTEEQRKLLLMFSDKMKQNVVSKICRKTALDIEDKRRSKKSMASWGEVYKLEDVEAQQGAAANLEFVYTIIQPKSFTKWLEKRNPKIQEEINKRFTKIVLEGDLGDVRALNGGDLGAFEFKFRDSCLTRIYYVPKGDNIYILCGGDKSDQGKTIVNRLPLLVDDLHRKIKM